MCIVNLMCSFKTSSIPAALLFLSALATFKISLSVIFLFISSLSGAKLISWDSNCVCAYFWLVKALTKLV